MRESGERDEREWRERESARDSGEIDEVHLKKRER